MARRRANRPPVERTAAGYVVNLDREELEMIVRLLGELRTLLVEGDPADHQLLRRLFPPAYHLADDAEAETEYQRLMGDELLANKVEAVSTVGRLLAEGKPLDEAGAHALLQSLNSVRLVLGTMIDIGENDDPGAIPDDHPLVGEMHLYHYLSYVLESTVQALAGKR